MMEPLVCQALECLQTAESEYIRHGVDASFVRISQTWGLKWFRKREIARRHYIFQKKLYDYHLTPAVGSKVTQFTFNGQHHYGYVTQCVTQTLDEYLNTYILQEDILSIPSVHTLCQQLANFCNQTCDIDFALDADLHGSNIGVLNNDFVLIDTGTLHKFFEARK